MTWTIDSAAYFDASGKCHSLADDLCLALGPLHRTLIHDTAGMAGDHKNSEAWTTTYDQHAADIIKLAATLCNALQRFGDVLAANGYNWWFYSRSTASGPEPDRPTASEPLYDSGMDLPASAKGDNGAGIDGSAIAGLMERVGRIPNGDVTKLGIARDAWKTFSTHDAVTGATDRIRTVTAVFADSSDPNHEDIEAKLTTLTQAAQLLAQAATGMVSPVTEHHDALHEMRDDIQAAIAGAEKEIAAALAITVAIVAVAAVASAGLATPAAAGGGAAVTIEIVQGAAVIIKNAVSVSRLLAIFGAVVVAGTASGGFTAIPDLAVNATLAGIAAMVVKVAGDEEAGDGNDGGSSAAVPNKAVTDEMARKLSQGIHDGEDCSEIAEHLQDVAGGVGEVLRVEPTAGELLTVEEYGIPEEFEYHEVYSDGKYVYDPRHSPNPIPIEEWRKTILGDNPGATINGK